VLAQTKDSPRAITARRSRWALSMPPSFAAGRRRHRRAPTPLGVVFVQFDAAFENEPQTGKDRLVRAARRVADPLPIAFTRLTREAANEAGSE